MRARDHVPPQLTPHTVNTVAAVAGTGAPAGRRESGRLVQGRPWPSNFNSVPYFGGLYQIRPRFAARPGRPGAAGA